MNIEITGGPERASVHVYLNGIDITRNAARVFFFTPDKGGLLASVQVDGISEIVAQRRSLLAMGVPETTVDGWEREGLVKIMPVTVTERKNGKA
jgi:hypothetical protein